MTKTNKILCIIIGVFVAGFVGCTVLLGSLTDDMCATTVIAQYPSPNGKLKAVLFQIDCGATTNFNSQLAIVPSELDATKRDALPQSFFAADCNGGQAPTARGGGPEIRVHWRSDKVLEVWYHELAGVIRGNSKSEGVSIEYGKFRQIRGD